MLTGITAMDIKLPPPGGATYADLEALPEHLTGEIIAGTLYAHPRPSLRHSAALSSLGSRLHRGYQDGEEGGPGGWWVLFEPELHVGGDVLVPDIAGWRRERMPVIGEAAFASIPPDWVCEVLSPGNARHDRSVKMGRYLMHGVAQLWLVDPAERTLEAFTAEAGAWRLETVLADDDPVCLPPFEALRFPLVALWAE